MLSSLIRKCVPLRHLMRPTVARVVTGPNISTSDGVQNPLKQLTNSIVGLSTDLIKQQEMKKSLRTLSTLHNHAAPKAACVTMSNDESGDFMALLPDLVRELTNVTNEFKCYDASKWFAKALQYNLPGGKKNRGIFTVSTYKNLVKNEQLTPENIKLAQYMGWCVEMLQCFFLIADDIMDNSTTRRGQQCWHQKEGVGMIAIVDALMVENAIYYILKQHFRHLDCYVDLTELFHEITFIATCGQSLDLMNANNTVANFSMDKYNSIVVNKTANYNFFLPFALAMHLAGFKDAEVFRQSKTILLEMGHFYQVQDDFLDCFGNPEITGKIGTDIKDNKCSWLAVVCMQRANAEQKAIMEECYGQSDPAKVERIKELYKELGIPNTYAIYEEESYNMIKTHIQQTSCGVLHEVFLKILNKIYQRDS